MIKDDKSSCIFSKPLTKADRKCHVSEANSQGSNQWLQNSTPEAFLSQAHKQPIYTCAHVFQQSTQHAYSSATAHLPPVSRNMLGQTVTAPLDKPLPLSNVFVKGTRNLKANKNSNKKGKEKKKEKEQCIFNWFPTNQHLPNTFNKLTKKKPLNKTLINSVPKQATFLAQRSR